MVAIELTFPARRLHATPWGRQVNEGAIEWPPSPWRLLRALIAVWHHKFPDVAEAEMRELIAALTAPPSFRLPAASQGHTRHYMPLGNEARTKVFDTFVAVAPDDPVMVVWRDVSLSEPQRDLLDRLLAAMTYFGRAESWVCARLCDNWKGDCNSVPLVDPGGASEDIETIRVLAAVGETEHANWHTEIRREHRDRKLRESKDRARSKGKPVEKVKLSKKEEAMIDANLPETVFDALHADTNQLRSAGWNRPPGSRWISYSRQRTAFSQRPRAAQRRFKALPTVARYAVCGAVRPRLTEALWIGERARLMLMGCSKAISNDRNAAPVFSGKRVDGSPLDGAHQHAHFLCEAAQGDARIGHLTVYAPMGFTLEDERALSRLRRLWGHGGHDLQLVLLGVGQPEDFAGLNERAGQGAILAESRVWVSRTPLVLTQHLKVRGARDLVEREFATREELSRVVRLELARRPWLARFAEEVEIEPRLGRSECGTRLGGQFTSWLKFRRERRDGNGRRAGSEGYAFRLVFPAAVRGPIALGYGCHFGLGGFVPVEG